MKVSQHPAKMILATRRDGSEGTGEAKRCRLCRSFMVEFVTSRGIRDARPQLPERETVCVRTEPVPCPMALSAKRWLDAMKDLTR